jgi:hypothetical protein
MGKDFWDDFEDYITNPYHPSRQFEDFEEENKSAEYYFGDESDDEEDEDDEFGDDDGFDDDEFDDDF